MEKLTFVQIEKRNKQHYHDSIKLWMPFINELNTHTNKQQSENEILNNLQKRIVIQGVRKNMHFELIYLKGEAVGIANFAIDTGTIYGLIEAGCGTVMGFFLKPEYRRKGFGREIYGHVENTLKTDGATRIYVTPDKITGVPFWLAMGFTDS
jgi:GNAT superfamily N-acetyltransferase